MGELTIRLRVDPATGRKNVVIQLDSDADALPIEHEQEHKGLVNRLFEAGLLKEAELGKVIVERLPDAAGVAAPAEDQPVAAPIAVADED